MRSLLDISPRFTPAQDALDTLDALAPALFDLKPQRSDR
jgi:hypothetical protein